MVDAEKLLAAITETERIARDCAGAPWVDDVPGMVHVDPAAVRENKQALGRLGYIAHTDNSPAGDVYRAHIARHDPAAVLRRCAADRRTVERHSTIRDAVFSTSPGKPGVWLPKCFYCNKRAPCDDLTDMMDRYGISTEEETG